VAQSSWVARLNLYRPIPSDPADWFDADEIAQSRAYNRPLQILSLAYGALTVAMVVVMSVLRVPQHLVRTLGVKVWPLQLLVVMTAMFFVIEIVTIPLDAWNRRHEQRWHMRNTTPRFAGPRDFVIGLFGALPLVAGLALGFWASVRLGPSWWLIDAGVAYVVLILTGLILVPALAPLGKMTHVDDEELRRRVRRVAREAGTAVVDVYQTDESKRSPQQNAYFMGLGRARRLVLTDNLLARPHREIDVALAQQISHIRRKRQLTLAGVLAVTLLISFGFLRLAAGWSPLLRFAGVRSVSDPASFPVVLVLFIAIFYFVEILRAWIKRGQNRVATLDSLEFTRDAEAFANLIRGKHVNNRAELAPNWWRRIRSHAPTPSEELALGAIWRATRRVTVLFTDIENSTGMLERLGDEEWYHLRRDHNEIIREHVQHHEGVEVDSAGDGFLIVFEDAGEALLCAIECQRALDEYNVEHPEADLRVRMGLHAGDVIRKGREVVGREVHVAARVADLARGGEILASSSVRQALHGTDRFAFEDERIVELKGFSDHYTLWRVRWTGLRERVGL